MVMRMGPPARRQPRFGALATSPNFAQGAMIMKISRRRFRPDSQIQLEGRLVLSHATAPSRLIAEIAGAADVAKPVSKITLVPGAPTPGTSSNASVSLSVHETLALGLPVYEQWTNRYPDGTTQTEDELIVPNGPQNGASQSSTIIAYSSLRGAEGIEKSVDNATTTQGVTTHNYTITLPDGALDTESKSEVAQGLLTIISGRVQKADGTSETFTGKIRTQGNKQTTDETLNFSNGTTRQLHSVVTFHGENGYTEKTTTSQPGVAPQTQMFVATRVRLDPPAM
jgi:hypothetical protein